MIVSVWCCRLAIVALTDQVIHQRIANEKYQAYVASLEMQVCTACTQMYIT